MKNFTKLFLLLTILIGNQLLAQTTFTPVTGGFLTTPSGVSSVSFNLWGAGGGGSKGFSEQFSGDWLKKGLKWLKNFLP